MAQFSLDRITRDLMNKFLEGYEINSSGITQDFEKFTAYCAIKNNYSTHFERDDFHHIIVGGSSDTGIDGVGIIVENNLICEIEELDDFIGNKDSVNIKFIFIQATTSKKFEASKFREFTLGVKEFFYDYAKPEQIKTKQRNNAINKKAQISQKLLEKTSYMSERPTCKLYYFLGNDIETKLGINNNVVEAEKKEITNLNLFDKVDIEVKGTNYINNLYRQTFNKPKVQIFFPNKISLPEIQGIKESYIGRINFREFEKLIVEESTGNIRNVFEDNVRYFNEGYDVNKKIKTTIETGNIDEFILLNNGVTIVTKKLTLAADNFTLEDYQIINGCQTSNILYQCRNHSGMENLWLTLRIIHTEDQEITNKITTATNSQTQVSAESLLSLLQFHKNLEYYYQSRNYKISNEKIFLYYARQEGKYEKDHNIKKSRIISIRDQAKSFAAMFLDVPEESSAFYGQRLRKKISKEIFVEDHLFEPYYISSVAHYEVFKYLRKTDSVTYRFHILMIVKYLILGYEQSNLSSENIKRDCEKILSIVQKKTIFPKYIKKSQQIIKEIFLETEYEEQSANKLTGLTKILKEKCQSMNFSHKSM